MCDRKEEAKNTTVILKFDLCCPCVNVLTLETGYMKTKQNSLSTVLNELWLGKEKIERTKQNWTSQAKLELQISFGVVSDDMFKEHESSFCVENNKI